MAHSPRLFRRCFVLASASILHLLVLAASGEARARCKFGQIYRPSLGICQSKDGKERPALPQESHSICAGRPEKNTRGRAAEAEGTGSAQPPGPAKFDPDFGTESSGITKFLCLCCSSADETGLVAAALAAFLLFELRRWPVSVWLARLLSPLFVYHRLASLHPAPRCV